METFKLKLVRLALRTPIWFITLFYLSMAAGLLVHAEGLVLGIPLGFLSFTIVEYAIHRWIFHAFEESNPALYDRLHGAHHRRPNDPRRRTVPFVYSMIVAVFICSLSLFGPIGAAIASGMTLGYVFLEFTHALAHADWARRSKFSIIRKLVRNHAIHHHVNSHTAYGITLQFWDEVFGSIMFINSNRRWLAL